MKNYKEKLKMNRGFTLIELLIVIAIIGILTTIVTVAVTGHIERARITAALSFSHSIERTIGHHLVGKWSFDEGAGTEVRDRSPFGNHGTMHNFTSPHGFSSDTPHDLIGAGAGRHSLRFDGVDDWVDIPNITFGTSDFTIELWLYDTDPTGGGLVGQGATHSVQMWITTDNRIQIRIWDGTTYSGGIVASVSSLTTNKWNHIVFVADRDHLGRIYINGSLDATSNISTRATQNNVSYPIYWT